jgi:hypothetical protein
MEPESTVWVTLVVYGRESSDELDWETVGVFSTEEKAVAACGTPWCLVGPLVFDHDYGSVRGMPKTWEGAYYPREAEQAEQAQTEE